MQLCMNCHEQFVVEPDEICWTCKSQKTAAATSSTAEQESHAFTSQAQQSKLSDEPVAVGRRKSKKILIAALIVIFALLAREGGYVNWFWYELTTHSKTYLSLNGEQTVQEGDKMVQSSFEKRSTYSNKTITKNYGASFNTNGAADFTDVAKVMAESLKKETGLRAVVNIDRLDMDGFYWLPLYKSGTCIYQLRIQVEGPNAAIYQGTLNGETNFIDLGICSIRSLKEALGKELAERVISAVKSTLKN